MYETQVIFVYPWLRLIISDALLGSIGLVLKMYVFRDSGK